MTKRVLFFILLAAGLALALRGLQLGSRPMHTDEAVKAVKIFRPLWEGGVGAYHFDPSEHHGPSLAYLTLVWEKLTLAPKSFNEMTESRLRSLTVLLGVGLVLLLWLVADGLGRNATIAAAFLTAVSPVMVYYSRDYIHETLLAFFTFLAIASAWRFGRAGKIRWLALAGAAVGMMQATKETFIFNIAAAAAAWWLARRPTKDAADKRKPSFKKSHLALVALVWGAVVFLLFSSFLTNPFGLRDALRTYFFWADRAAGGGQGHGWGFYWERLLFFHVRNGPVFSEGLIFILALGGAAAAFARGGVAGVNTSLARFLAFYTGILAAVYTAIPYKTPWCVLEFWQGAILLAGIGAAALVSRLAAKSLKIAACAVFLTGGGQLAFQAWQAAVPLAADPGNPWAYEQTSPGLLDLVAKVEALSRASPDGYNLHINVMAPDDDYYPLPWYLRRFNESGWWADVPADPKVPVDPYGPVVIVSPTLEATLDAKKAGQMAGIFVLRPGTFLSLYVQTNLWNAYLQQTAKPESPRTSLPGG